MLTLGDFWECWMVFARFRSRVQEAMQKRNMSCLPELFITSLTITYKCIPRFPRFIPEIEFEFMCRSREYHKIRCCDFTIWLVENAYCDVTSSWIKKWKTRCRSTFQNLGIIYWNPARLYAVTNSTGFCSRAQCLMAGNATNSEYSRGIRTSYLIKREMKETSQQPTTLNCFGWFDAFIAFQFSFFRLRLQN